MNPKALFVILLIVLVVYLGISQKTVCDPPYMQHGKECCMDANKDLVCDIDQPEAFVTTTSGTTTTLDPCIGLTGYDKTACEYSKEKRGYYDDCVDACDNASRDCRASCDQQNGTKAKMSCADACFKGYSQCYSQCGEAPSVAGKNPEESMPKKNSTAMNLTTVY